MKLEYRETPALIKQMREAEYSESDANSLVAEKLKQMLKIKLLRKEELKNYNLKSLEGSLSGCDFDKYKMAKFAFACQNKKIFNLYYKMRDKYQDKDNFLILRSPSFSKVRVFSNERRVPDSKESMIHFMYLIDSDTSLVDKLGYAHLVTLYALYKIYSREVNTISCIDFKKVNKLIATKLSIC